MGKHNQRVIRLNSDMPSMQTLRDIRNEFSGHIVFKCPFDLEIKFASYKTYVYSDIMRLDWIHTPDHNFTVILTAVRGYSMHTCRLYDNVISVSVVNHGQLLPMNMDILQSCTKKKSAVKTIDFHRGEGVGSNVRVKIEASKHSPVPNDIPQYVRVYEEPEYEYRPETRVNPFTSEPVTVYIKERK